NGDPPGIARGAHQHGRVRRATSPAAEDLLCIADRQSASGGALRRRTSPLAGRPEERPQVVAIHESWRLPSSVGVETIDYAWRSLCNPQFLIARWAGPEKRYPRSGWEAGTSDCNGSMSS